MTTPTIGTDADVSIGPDLEQWLYGDQGDMRSLILEVRLPERRVAFESGVAPRGMAHHLVTEDREGRNRAMRQLADYLGREVGVPIKVLNSAGAIVVSATPSQARRFVPHPLIKGVRMNRTLPPRMAAV